LPLASQHLATCDVQPNRTALGDDFLFFSTLETQAAMTAAILRLPYDSKKYKN